MDQNLSSTDFFNKYSKPIELFSKAEISIP
jgi:hypothetical protein